MGGIVGLLRFDDQGADRGLLVRQTERLAARGPDDGAVYVEGPMALGFRRLDVEGRGHQPHWDEESRLAILFDGEISRLEGADVGGEAGLPEADAPRLLLDAYREWGDAFVERLHGEFAFAILDRQGPRLILGRDRVGRRPLYYHRDRRRFAFASEVDALVDAPGVPRLLDPEAVVTWFREGFVPEPRTLVRDVWAVPPGAVLAVEPGRVRARRYAAAEAESGSPEQAFSRLRERARRAVVSALHDDPAVLLSGGRVSAYLAELARRRAGGGRGFHLAGLEARPPAPELRAGEGAVARDQDPVEGVRAALRVMDLPIGDPAFPGHALALSSFASGARAPRAVLVGHGALDALGEPPSAGPSAEGALASGVRSGSAARPRPVALPPPIRLASFDLRAVDRLSVLGQRAVRAPLASAETSRVAARLPAESASWGRLARGVIATDLAAASHHRDASPLADWMRGPVNDLIEHLLFSARGGTSGLLDSRRLRLWWYQHQLGWADRAPLLWRAAAFEHWYRRTVSREEVLPSRRRRRRRRGAASSGPASDASPPSAS